MKDDSVREPHTLSKYLGEATNNIAEYLALVYGLQEALQLGYDEVTVKSDSELLVKQTQGVYKVRDPNLRLLQGLVQHLIRGFRSVHIEHIPRTKNAAADRLAGNALTAAVVDN